MTVYSNHMKVKLKNLHKSRSMLTVDWYYTKIFFKFNVFNIKKPVYLNIFENVPGGVWKREDNYRYFSLVCDSDFKASRNSGFLIVAVSPVYSGYQCEEGCLEELHHDEGSRHPHQRHAGEHHAALRHRVDRHVLANIFHADYYKVAASVLTLGLICCRNS